MKGNVFDVSNTKQNESKKEYFRLQRLNPTGNYTEYVVRTYYLIYKACKESFDTYCLKNYLNIRKMSFDIYDGIYDEPDHDYYNVISGCLKELEKLGYTSTSLLNGMDVIRIEKPLDFLRKGEHEYYIEKYGIHDSKTNSVSEIIINPIRSEIELKETLNHMLHPETYPDPLDRKADAEKKKVIRLNIRCENCNGQYVHRSGKYGDFFGCGNYPKCKNTKSIADLSYSILEQNGINIYETDHICWKCGKTTKLRSYFPHIDIMLAEPLFAHIYDFSIIRLSIADSLDAYLSRQYYEICIKNSKQAGFAYMANTCSHCNSLLGSQMSLNGMYDNLLNAVHVGQIEKYVAGKITPTDILLPISEWQLIIKDILSRSPYPM